MELTEEQRKTILSLQLDLEFRQRQVTEAQEKLSAYLFANNIKGIDIVLVPEEIRLVG